MCCRDTVAPDISGTGRRAEPGRIRRLPARGPADELPTEQERIRVRAIPIHHVGSRCVHTDASAPPTRPPLMTCGNAAFPVTTTSPRHRLDNDVEGDVEGLRRSRRSMTKSKVYDEVVPHSRIRESPTTTTRSTNHGYSAEVERQRRYCVEVRHPTSDPPTTNRRGPIPCTWIPSAASTCS